MFAMFDSVFVCCMYMINTKQTFSCSFDVCQDGVEVA